MTVNENAMTVKEAAEYLGVTVQYAYQLRYNGKGPKCRKEDVGAPGSGPRLRILYKKTDRS